MKGFEMLKLTRKKGQTIFIGNDIVLTFDSKTRIGIEAPREVEIVRGELKERPDNQSKKKLERAA